MATLLLSDIHLDVSPRGKQRMADFVAFLRAVDTSRINRIILLGDLFDFWFEYKHVIFSGYLDVLRAFADLREHGVAFELVCGNHDFWAGRFLEQRLGFTVHTRPVEMDFGGRRVLMVHGDGLNPRDWWYRVYKRIARARWLTAVFRHSHYPVIEEYPTPNGTGLYINTGDWLYHRSYVEWDGTEFHLHQGG